MIEIIKANEQHIAEISDLWMKFMRFSQDIDPIFTPQDGAITVFIKEHLRPAMKAENSLVLVALGDRKIVGYSYSLIKKPANSLDKRDKYGYIHDMFITGSHRRKGIGEMMFGEIIKWFHSSDINRIELDIITQNLTASSFWEKHGFMEFGRSLYHQL